MRATRQNFSRRDFIKLIAVAGGAGMACHFGIDALQSPDVTTDTRLLMGTVIHITIIGQSPQEARAAIDRSFDRMSNLESILSRFQPSSQLSQLNQKGRLIKATPALISVVQQAQELSQRSGGAFDITVKPLLDLFENANTLPSQSQVEAALPRVDYRNIGLDEDTISFARPDMSITLDGIAKGFIVDEGVAMLKASGLSNVLVEAGGDLMAFGEKAPNTPWKVGVQAPRAQSGNLETMFTLRNQAVATSGDYIQMFTPDFSQHHIIDPRTGYSPPDFTSVSILAPTVAMADGLATTVMVMGEEGLRLVEDLPGCDAYAITKELSVIKTSGIQDS